MEPKTKLLDQVRDAIRLRHLNAWCELITDGYTEGAPSR